MTGRDIARRAQWITGCVTLWSQLVGAGPMHEETLELRWCDKLAGPRMELIRVISVDGSKRRWETVLARVTWALGHADQPHASGLVNPPLPEGSP